MSHGSWGCLDSTDVSFFLTNFTYLFIYFWLCWVFVSVRGLSLVVASGDHSSSRCTGLSLSRPLLLRGTGSRRAGSVVVARGLSCSAACGIFPDQGSNPCPLHWQADSQPLRHQGSPQMFLDRVLSRGCSQRVMRLESSQRLLPPPCGTRVAGGWKSSGSPGLSLCLGGLSSMATSA